MKNRIMLTKAEKEEARKGLASFIKKNPVRNLGDVRLGFWNRIYSLTKNYMNTMFTKPLALVMALAVVGSGGTVFASQDAQPGDALYGVKTHFNEPVREFLALNPEAKADYAITRVERRLIEAEGLSQKDGLTPELEAELKDLIQAHIDDLNAYLEKVQTEVGDEKLVGLNNKLENLVGNYEKKLAKLDGDTDEEEGKKEKILALVERVREGKDKETVVKDQSAASGKEVAAQNKIDEVEKFLIANKSAMSEVDYNDAVDKLVAAKLVFEDAQKALADADYTNAFDKFKDAMEKVQDLKKEINPAVKEVKQEEKQEVKEESDDDEDDNGRNEAKVKEENKVKKEEKVKEEVKVEDENEVEDEDKQEQEVEDEDEDKVEQDDVEDEDDEQQEDEVED